MTSGQNQETDLTPNPSPLGEGKKDIVANKIARGILRVQNFVSERMNRFKYLKLMLICFCVMSAAISSYVLIDSIVSKPKHKIKVDRIRYPRQNYEPSEELFDEKIPEEIYQQIQDYKRFMDSTGERIRPGLADSMQILEEMYLQQQK